MDNAILVNQGDVLINNDIEREIFHIGIYKYKHTLETTYKPLNKLSIFSNEKRFIHIYFEAQEYMEEDTHEHIDYCFSPTIYSCNNSYYDTWIMIPIQIPEFNNIVDLMTFISNNTIGINGVLKSNWRSKYKYKEDICFIW